MIPAFRWPLLAAALVLGSGDVLGASPDEECALVESISEVRARLRQVGVSEDDETQVPPDAVVFLASRRASFISGVNLVVDGTLTVRIPN